MLPKCSGASFEHVPPARECLLVRDGVGDIRALAARQRVEHVFCAVDTCAEMPLVCLQDVFDQHIQGVLLLVLRHQIEV
ncbi:hypothetical protein SDC9_176970 [bioreactor metagenome]|uniref:Uncharacterized protein n=1 Tax=bioreactor metagenome TaxID=1076179 RepID=A0A645GRH9_9ZZZZ